MDVVKYRMVELVDGVTRMTCWVDKPVAAGNQVTLRTSEEPSRLWMVWHVYDGLKTKAELSDQSTWAVGGIHSGR